MTLRVNQISKYIGPNPILNSLNVDIPLDSTTVLIGPSGSGKTTLLRILAGLDKPDSGKVFLKDTPSKTWTTSLFFQNNPLYPHLNVFENVAFPLRLQANRLSERELQSTVHETLMLLKINQLAERKVTELSGGQYQRVGIARTLVRKTQFFFFDEPMAHLDENLSQEILADLRTIQRELKLTFVYVTHNKLEAFSLADQLVIMHDGQIAQVGTPQELFEQPNSLFVAEFLSPNSLNQTVDGNKIIVYRPEDTTVQVVDSLESGGTSVKEVVYLGNQYLVNTDLGAGITKSPLKVGTKVILSPKRSFTFKI